MSLTAFFLCAGYGLRLRPLTDRVAKPALTFQGVSALEINLKKADVLGPHRRIANSHHLPDQIGALARRLDLEVLHEPEILGTGGCLFNAASILGQTDHFLVHNADLIHDLDLRNLWRRHLASGALATLAGVRSARHDTLAVSPEGGLLGVHGYGGFAAPADAARLTFAGIAFYRREFLGFLNPGCEDVKAYWKKALESGAPIRVADCSASAWHDFGTPQGLWNAAKFVMDATGEFSYRYPSPAGGKPCVSNEAGQEGLPEGLRNVLIYEKTASRLRPGLKNRVFGRDFEWEIMALMTRRKKRK